MEGNMKMSKDACNHKNAYYFHDSAPAYCPNCKKYVDGVYNN